MAEKLGIISDEMEWNKTMVQIFILSGIIGAIIIFLSIYVIVLAYSKKWDDAEE